MKFLLTGIFATLQLRLRGIRGWVILLLPLLVAAVMLFVPVQEVTAPVEVGVCLPEEGGEALWQQLQQRNSAVIRYIQADEAQIERNVAAGRWDCGLVLAEDFDERLEDLDTDRIITLWTGNGSVVYPLVRENVSACIAELISPEIARQYLLDSGIAADQAALEDSGFRLEIQGESDRVLVHMSTSDGAPLEPLTLARRSTDVIMNWMVSAVILVWMFLSATDLGRWMETPAVRRMQSIRGRTMVMLSRIGADAVIAWVAGTAAVLILGGGLSASLAVLGYVLFWMAAAILAAHFSGIWNALPVFMPLMVVASLLFSSALVDVKWFLPVLAEPSKLFAVSLFLRACEGGVLPMVMLCAGAVLLLGVSVVTDKIRKI